MRNITSNHLQWTSSGLETGRDENGEPLTVPNEVDRVTQKNTPPCFWCEVIVEHSQKIQRCLLQITTQPSLMKLGVADRKHEPVSEYAVCAWVCSQFLQ